MTIATDAIITLGELHCAKESDGTGHSEPYLWPVLVWIDGNLVVRASAPALGNARVVIKQDMRSGETAAIPASVGGVLRLRLDERVIVRGMFLVAALWENDESPSDAVRAGFLAFKDELRDAVADNLLGLSEEVSQDATIAIINTRVRDRVTSAIKGALTAGEKARVFAGTLNLDDIVGSDFKNLSDVASTLITLTFAGDTGGRLLRYQDASQTGGGDVSNPQVIGQAGWQGFTFLFSGGNGVIYAVDPQGRLLRYQDASQTGGGDVSNPQVIGQAGWQGFTFLFSGGNGVIYAVDEFKTASEAYEVRGELRVGPVAIDRCQAQVDRLNAAQEAVASVEAQIEELQTTLSTASPGDKPSLIAEITRLQREDLLAAKANVDDARRALQACRSAG